MPKIIISYRRKDSDAITGRIRDRIAQYFGEKSVFMDIDSIPLGVDFRKQIQEALSENQMFLAVIGPNWTGPVEGGPARILDETDPVRIEVETALKRGVPTIPVLVGGAQMPRADELPESLKDLPFFNAAEVSAGLDFNQHIDRLIRAMEQILKGKAGLATAAPARRTWLLVGSVLGALLVLLAAAYSYRDALLGTRLQGDATTAQNTPVSTAPQPQLQAAPQPPVATAPPQTTTVPPPPQPSKPVPPPQPAAAPPDAATARAAALACEPDSVPIFYDNFKVIDPAWEGVSADPRGGSYLADGQLVMAAAPDDDRYVSRGSSALRNATLCAHVISPPAMNDPLVTSGGVLFWGNASDDFYDVLIYPGGGYSIEKWLNGSSTIIAKEKSAAIRTGPGAVNEIKIANKNNVTTLFINGQKIQDIKGQAGKDDVDVGFIVNSEAKQIDAWRFSDVVMTQPNYADELTDFGVKPQDVLRSDVGTQTPTTIPNARVIGTRDLYAAIQRGSLDGAPFAMVDVLYDSHGKTIRGAKRISDGGSSGDFDDSTQTRLRTQLMALTKNNLTTPIVFFCEGAICWESYNAVLRAEKMGFTRLYWYRGGLNAWKAAGLPMN